MLGLGLAMPLPWSAEDGSGFDASSFHLGSPQCTNEESGVVGRPPQVSNPVPASFAQVRLRVVWKVAECHGHRTLYDVVDVSTGCDNLRSRPRLRFKEALGSWQSCSKLSTHK